MGLNKSGMTPKTSLNQKKPDDDNLDAINAIVDEDIHQKAQTKKNNEQFEMHQAKMKKVSQIAESLKDKGVQNKKAKVVGSKTGFRDSFGQDLNVPSLPKEIDGILHQDRSKKSVQREMVENHDNYGTEDQEKTVSFNTNHEDGSEKKFDGQITRKNKDGSKTIIDKDGSKRQKSEAEIAAEKAAIAEGIAEAEFQAEQEARAEFEAAAASASNDDAESEQESSFDAKAKQEQEQIDYNAINKYATKQINGEQNQDPPSPVFNSQDSKSTIKTYNDINLRPNNKEEITDQQTEETINIKENEQVAENSHAESDGESRYDQFNKIRLNQIKELARIQKRQELERKETSTSRFTDSFNQPLSNFSTLHAKGSLNKEYVEPVSTHKEQTDVVYSTDANQNVNVDEIYDTVIDEQIFQSESGVIKRKFYKRVIKSSPIKNKDNNNNPTQTTISENIDASPGKRSCTITPKKELICSESPKPLSPEEKKKAAVSNLVKQLNIHDESPVSKSVTPITPVHSSPNSSRRSSSVDSSERKRSYANSINKISNRISPEKPKSPKHNDQEDLHDNLDSDDIEKMLSEVEGELTNKEKEYQFFVKDRTRKLEEIERIRERRKAKDVIVAPEEAYTPRSQARRDSEQFKRENRKNDSPFKEKQSRHEFLNSSIKRNGDKAKNNQIEKINQNDNKQKDKLKNMIYGEK